MERIELDGISLEAWVGGDGPPVVEQGERRPVPRPGEEEGDIVVREHPSLVVAHEPGATVGDDGIGVGGRDEEGPLGHEATLPTNIIPSPIDR